MRCHAAVCCRAGTRAWELRGGFALARRGRIAAQIGPIVADGEAQAIALLDAALRDLHGPVFLDVPDRWRSIAQWLAGRGFGVQRPFLRMSRGRGGTGDASRLFVIAGPEFG